MPDSETNIEVNSVAPGKKKMASRKFWYTILVTILITAMTVFKVISGEIYADILTIVVLAYMAGNVSEKFARNKG